MVYVKIVSSNPNLNFDGDWDKGGDPQSIVNELKKEAERFGIPVMVSFKDHETYSITPHGQVIRGALFDDDKVTKSRNSRLN